MPPKNPRVFVAKLPYDMSEGELERMFKRFGEICHASMKRGYGFVVSSNAL